MNKRSARVKSPKAYAQAGVDVDLGNRVKSTLPALLAQAQRPEVLGKVGGFGGLFALDTRRYREPVLVASTDGVGTKLKVAFAMNRHDTIGEDLVNHCVNDIAVVGAEPLFFLDYLGTGKLEKGVFNRIIRGFVRGCARNGCALIGGETAQMPGFYQPGEYDVCGTIVGVVERRELIDGSRVRPGNQLIGLGASGLHTNGYSLARKVLFDQLGYTVDRHLPELGRTIGKELLQVHRSYGPLLQNLRARFNTARRKTIHALAHITGGGFVDNLPRVLPPGTQALVRKQTWELPAIFRLLQSRGQIPEAEMYQVFNMGIGMIIIVEASACGAVLEWLRQHREAAWLIGEVQHSSTRTPRVVMR